MIRQGYRAPIQAALVAAGFAVVLVMGVLSVWLIQRSQAANNQLTHAMQVSNLLAGLRADNPPGGKRPAVLPADGASRLPH